MSTLTLLVCSLLIASSCSQPYWWPRLNGGGYNGGRHIGGGGSSNTGGEHGGGGHGGEHGGGGHGGEHGGGGHGGGSSNTGGENGGGGSNCVGCNSPRTPDIKCINSQANGDTAKCQKGYVAVCCSCGMGCGTYDFVGDDTCRCQCHKVDWTSARCCKNL